MSFTLPDKNYNQYYTLGASPGAGNPYILIPGLGESIKVVGGRFILTTAVAVANRVVRISLGDGTDTYAGICSSVVQAASLVYEYVFMAVYTGNGYLSNLVLTLPWLDNIWLNPSLLMMISVDNMQAADAITGIRLVLEKTIYDKA